MVKNIFVYGTLKRGMSNSKYLPNYAIKHIQKATTKGTLYYISSGAYPCLKRCGNNLIHGELISVKDKYWEEILANIDVLEGYPTFYNREIIQVINENGEKDFAWVYIFNDENDPYLGEEIKDGNFKGERPRENTINELQALLAYYYGDL